MVGCYCWRFKWYLFPGTACLLSISDAYRRWLPRYPVTGGTSGFNPAGLGLLLRTPLRAGSAFQRSFDLPAPARLSLIRSSSLGICLVPAAFYLLMAFVRQRALFSWGSRRLASAGLTLFCAELWRKRPGSAMPSWARGRMNATGHHGIARRHRLGR